MSRATAGRNICELYAESEHEKVVLWSDPSSDYRGVIAVHSTALGPAVGGARFWNYRSDEEASLDALRLSRGMTYKSALAGLPFGGGKSVIIGDNRTTDRESIFRAHGRFVESFGGCYITAEDVGTTPADMEYVRMETRHVAGLMCGSGNPSPVTAHGVLRAMQAAAKHRWGTDDLKGVRVAVQGCGSTGYHLSKELHARGARLTVTDVDAARAETAAREFDAALVAPEEILDVEANIYAPCALGGVIDDRSLARLKAEVVVGSANNQLSEERHGDALEELGVTYVPDYLANAGGLINGCRELLGWDVERTLEKVRAIYDTTLLILALARSEGVAAHRMADRLAESRLAAAVQGSLR
ncbi:MAG TPA: Glu/Leu/Phe/Val dehydrogenase dimerization domain-containing protein [Pyrinomonadaceae bacterium]|nr:Glu/Leu/Phe/Val dehydrogenase dimerization domain-containing protein [Pyrinomonadaceae bacterium]